MNSITRQLKKAARIILVGAPGVGKGTQTERLLARYPELSSISSGDLLRENVRKKTPLGKSNHLIESYRRMSLTALAARRSQSRGRYAGWQPRSRFHDPRAHLLRIQVQGLAPSNSASCNGYITSHISSDPVVIPIRLIHP
jgi:adenylate kinase